MATRKRTRRRPANPRALTVSDTFREFVLDQLTDVGDVRARSMFGGVGLYYQDLFFGIIARDVLYLKTDASNRADYEAAGMHPFKPYPDRPATMQYYSVPVDVLESSAELARWGKKAIAAARATAAPAVKRR